MPPSMWTNRTRSRLQDKDAGFGSRDFGRTPTVQSTNELIRDTVNLWKWDSSTRTGWSVRPICAICAGSGRCFHFCRQLWPRRTV